MRNSSLPNAHSLPGFVITGTVHAHDALDGLVASQTIRRTTPCCAFRDVRHAGAALKSDGVSPHSRRGGGSLPNPHQARYRMANKLTLDVSGLEVATFE